MSLTYSWSRHLHDLLSKSGASVHSSTSTRRYSTIGVCRKGNLMSEIVQQIYQGIVDGQQDVVADPQNTCHWFTELDSPFQTKWSPRRLTAVAIYASCNHLSPDQVKGSEGPARYRSSFVNWPWRNSYFACVRIDFARPKLLRN